MNFRKDIDGIECVRNSATTRIIMKFSYLQIGRKMVFSIYLFIHSGSLTNVLQGYGRLSDPAWEVLQRL